jgi:hypothetical protein
MNEYSDFDEARIRHLELVQGVISRLGTNSFLVKGWAITVSGAFLGFAITEKKWGLALISLVPTALFWGLDAYYLRAERLFRALHDEILAKQARPFSMDTRDLVRSTPTAAWANVIFSITLRLFYGVLTVSGGAVITILVC